MLSRLLRLFFLPGLSFLVLAGPPVTAQTPSSSLPTPPASPAPILSPVLNIDGLGKGTVPLEGPWQFHLGDDPTWAAPTLDDSTASGWEQLAADQPWGAQGHENREGFGWYRRHLRVTSATGVAPEFALLLGQVDDAYEVYWNGTLVGAVGKMPPKSVWYYHGPMHSFGLGPMHSGVLAVRVWKAPFSSFDSGQLGGFEATPLLGSASDIAAAKAVDDYQWLRRQQFRFAILFLDILVAALGFVVWVRDRTQWIVFWLAAFCLGPSVNSLIAGLRLHIPYPIAIGLEQPMFAVADISLWFLLILLLQLGTQGRLVRWVRIAAVLDMGASLLDAVVTLPLSNPNWQLKAQIADGILTALVTVVEIIPLILLIRALISHKRLASERWVVAIFACLSQGIEALATTAEQGERFTHWTWGNTLAAPMFAINGNSISAAVAARTLLLASLIYAIYRNSVESRRRQEATEQELRNARELQQVLVPEALPALPGYALTSAYRPAQEVGGDFFQIIPLENGSTLVVLGDVSGKGLKAAMAVSLIVGATRMIADYTSSPAEILAALNRRLIGRVTDGFVTAIAMRLQPDGTCVIATAGHPPPFLNQQELSLPGALPLGITHRAEYDEVSVDFSTGDHFALYTDGLLEARSQTGELYGFARLESLFATRPNATQATEAAIHFGQDDDITVLTLIRLATSQESSAIHSVPAI